MQKAKESKASGIRSEWGSKATEYNDNFIDTQKEAHRHTHTNTHPASH